MVNNDKFFTGQKPAAVLKHAVLMAYAYPYFSMVGRWHRGPMWLIDGYAGPGMYDADESGTQIDGSPIVALRLARKQRGFSPSRDVRCVFIEADSTFVAALRKNVQPFQKAGLHVEVLHGSVEDRLTEAWSRVAGNPVLTFIDPFGVSAVSKAIMTGLLLKPTHKSSEVLVNINVEAISRHGGYLQWDAAGDPEVRPGLSPNGVEKSDTFFGGLWWRRSFLEARDRYGDAGVAATVVVDEYREAIRAETGASSLVVPIRRSRTGALLFYFTLFYRHPGAGYKFADAAAIGQLKWREAFRQKDLEELRATEAAEPTLFGLDLAEEVNEVEANAREKALFDASVAHIEANILRMLAPLPSGQGIQAGANIVELLGDCMSLAGEKELRAAWNGLIKAQKVRKRASSPKELWKHYIIKQ
ncbi:three-Cys-motif partner protein TcmP [Nocardioides kongjuensis]|uniref:Three-Cys-motif partner protein n=1 Tax=Nocardioides kongjuensis TaxID=349522 RepID=A0A852S1K7_9ACTN|nr:three-Cys-motif partner protein TcmP [Nocardioides kongjuensis]NYD32712.1 three-Cys-motif partner protein [Nocardioides kongjuensis]